MSEGFAKIFAKWLNNITNNNNNKDSCTKIFAKMTFSNPEIIARLVSDSKISFHILLNLLLFITISSSAKSANIFESVYGSYDGWLLTYRPRTTSGP